jgi:hypothetical protein
MSRAAAGAHLLDSEKGKLSRTARRHSLKRTIKKNKKQINNLHCVYPTRDTIACGQKFTLQYLKEKVVVFDGGIGIETAQGINSDVPGWCCHKIRDDDLVVCNPPSCDMGLTYKQDNDSHPVFILFPRKDALEINKDGRELCTALSRVSKKTPNLVRGKTKEVFGNQKYCCIGAKRRRFSSGIEPGHYKFGGSISSDDWDCVVSAVSRCEHAFYAYSNTDVIRHIKKAKELVDWETIKCSTSKENEYSRIFNGIAFGVNVYLRAHIDEDFTYSATQVHLNNVDYKIDDDTVCFFCFPRLGVAVPLKPGDFLLFNAMEYHCVSSRCYDGLELYCVSSYLKTAVVGGNDNGKVLTDMEKKCMFAYEDWKKKCN